MEMNNEAQLRLSDAKVELDRWRIHRGGKTYALTPIGQLTRVRTVDPISRA